MQHCVALGELAVASRRNFRVGCDSNSIQQRLHGGALSQAEAKRPVRPLGQKPPQVSEQAYLYVDRTGFALKPVHIEIIWVRLTAKPCRRAARVR